MTLRMNKSPRTKICDLHLAVLALVCFFGFETSIQTAYAEQFGFGNVVNISNSGGGIGGRVAAQGRRVYVVWQDQTFGNGDILFRMSTDRGATFESSINLSDNTGGSVRPKIAVFGLKVYVAWTENSAGKGEILFRASRDGGATFGPAINLSDTNRISSSTVAIAAFGHSVYVAWYDVESENVETFFTASNDHGATFGGAINLSNNPGTSILVDPRGSGLTYAPQLAAFGKKVYVAWDRNSDIFFTASADRGASFDPVINLSDDSERSVVPSLASFGNLVYVAWIQEFLVPPTLDVAVRASTDRGATFAAPIRLGTPLVALEDIVTAAWGSSVFVAWRAGVTIGIPPEGNIIEVSFAASTDKGTTFSPAVSLSETPGFGMDSLYTAIAVRGSKVYVAWAEDDPNEVLIRASTDKGATFGSPVNVSNNPGLSRFPTVALDKNKVYVVWTDSSFENEGEVLDDTLFRAFRAGVLLADD